MVADRQKMGQAVDREKVLQQQVDASSRKNAKVEGFVGIGTFEKRATGTYAMSDKALKEEKSFRQSVDRQERVRQALKVLKNSNAYIKSEDTKNRRFSKAVESQNVKGTIPSVESRGVHNMVVFNPFRQPDKELERDSKTGLLHVKNSIWG